MFDALIKYTQNIQIGAFFSLFSTSDPRTVGTGRSSSFTKPRILFAIDGDNRRVPTLYSLMSQIISLLCFRIALSAHNLFRPKDIKRMRHRASHALQVHSLLGSTDYACRRLFRSLVLVLIHHFIARADNSTKKKQKRFCPIQFSVCLLPYNVNVSLVCFVF